MKKYILTARSNYSKYVNSAAKVENFSIPLSKMDGYSQTIFEGIIIVGRRNYLSAKQIEYLSAFNKDYNNDIKIITYDVLLE